MNKNILVTILLACFALYMGYIAIGKYTQTPEPVQSIDNLIPKELTSFSEGVDSVSKIKIYSFFDYSCTYCKETERILSKLQHEFEGQFQINYVPIPLAGENSVTY